MSDQIITVNLSKTMLDAFVQNFGTKQIHVIPCKTMMEANEKIFQDDYSLLFINAVEWSVYEIQEAVRSTRRISNLPIAIVTPIRKNAAIIEDGADICLYPDDEETSILAHSMGLYRRYTVLGDNCDVERPVLPILHRGDLTIDRRGHQVMLKGVPIHLQRREFRLLTHFAENPGIVFTHDKISDILQIGDYNNDHNVAVTISELRRKFHDNAKHPAYIETIRGIGYRFLPKE